MKLCPLSLSLVILTFPLVNKTEHRINLRAKHMKHISEDCLWSTKLNHALTLPAKIHLKSLQVSTSKLLMDEGHSTAVV